MRARLAVLHPAHVEGWRPAKLDLGPFQITNLDRPQAMPEGDQDQRRIPMRIAPATVARRLISLSTSPGVNAVPMPCATIQDSI